MDDAMNDGGPGGWMVGGSRVSVVELDRSDDDVADKIRSRLSSVIEGEIIPRLMLAHRDQAAPVAPDDPLPDLDVFADALLDRDPARSLAMVDGLVDGGVAVDRLFLGLFAPAARRLGEMWESDVADFLEVTVALSRLQHMLRDLTPRGQGPDARQPEGTRKILLLPAPGERHLFGLSMVEKFFRGASWDVVSLATTPQRDGLALLKREWFAVVGISLSCETGVDALTALIRKIRKSSRNASIGILVGGDYFLRNPQAALLMGADASAVDGPGAVKSAQSLLDLRARAC